jgi:hypothetical protein
MVGAGFPALAPRAGPHVEIAPMHAMSVHSSSAPRSLPRDLIVRSLWSLSGAEMNAGILRPAPPGGIPADHPFFDQVAIPYLALDIIFTLDQLTAVDQADPQGILTGHLDLKRAGMIGPSPGGLVGAEACHLDPRLRAFLSTDVHMPTFPMPSSTRRCCPGWRIG